MPKKGGKQQLGAQERARLAVIPELYAIYSTYFSESVIDMIAKQCQYDMDLCLTTLADMVQDQQRPSQTNHTEQPTGVRSVTPDTSKPNANRPPNLMPLSVPSSASTTPVPPLGLTPTSIAMAQHSSIPSSLASSPVAAAASNNASSSNSSNTAAKKKGILFLSPRPSSDLLKKQPESIWKKRQQQQQSANDSSATTPSPNIPADDDHIEDEEGDYDSDANDESLHRSPGYTYTGFETQPYFDLQPSLLDSVPPLMDLPVKDTILDPAASSAARWRKIPDRDGISAASPAHPTHHLHALYLQLQTDESDQPVQARSAPLFTAPVAPAAEELEAPENMTPSQAKAFQAQAHQRALEQKKAHAAWMKQHEQEKRNVRAQTFTTLNESPASAVEGEFIPEDEGTGEVADTDEAAADDLSLDALELEPDDIPVMPPLTKKESQASYHKIRTDPTELEQLLIDLFQSEIEPAVVKAVVESMLAIPLDTTNETAARDVAQECCDTLLAMVNENEKEENKRFQQISKKKSKQPTPSSSSSVPFVPSTHQMTDEEYAQRLAVDPDFNPDTMTPLDANVGLKPVSTMPAAPVQRNKKGHIILPRGGTNVWSARTNAISNVAPDLSAQWKLTALQKAFPTVEQEVIDECFRANQFNFQQTKDHLRAIYPDVILNDSVRPSPVEQPWSQTQMHHSKVSSTSVKDAERGIIKDGGSQANWDASANGSHTHFIHEELSDAILESTIGAVLDNHSASVSSSNSNLRTQASLHARRRAAYFSAAIGAFTRGQSGLATDLASKGKLAGQQLASTSAQAGLEIFIANNLNQDCTRAIDLHGLHVPEAIRILSFVLHRRASSSSSRTSNELSVITGIGHHSEGGIRGARLPLAVQEFLKRNNYNYSNQRGEGEIKVFFR